MKFITKFKYSLLLGILALVMPVSSVFAQIDPGDPLYEPVGGVSLVGAIEGLYDIGVWPVIAVAALLSIATLLYKRFRV